MQTPCGYSLRASTTLTPKFTLASVRGEGGPVRAHACGTRPSNAICIHFKYALNKPDELHANRINLMQIGPIHAKFDILH